MVSLFLRPGGGWTDGTSDQDLTASDGMTRDLLGVALDVSADGTVVAGAPQNVPGALPRDQARGYVAVSRPLGVADGDGDGIPDDEDNYPPTPNGDQANIDADGVGDVCDYEDDNDGVPDEGDRCALTSIPEGVPTVRLGVNRCALTDGDLEFDTTAPAGDGPNVSYTTSATLTIAHRAMLVHPPTWSAAGSAFSKF